MLSGKTQTIMLVMCISILLWGCTQSPHPNNSSIASSTPVIDTTYQTVPYISTIDFTDVTVIYDKPQGMAIITNNSDVPYHITCLSQPRTYYGESLRWVKVIPSTSTYRVVIEKYDVLLIQNTMGANVALIKLNH